MATPAPSTSVFALAPPRTRWARVGMVAASQAGHIAVWQARAVGLAAEDVRRRARREAWTRVHHSVWRLPGVPASTLGRLWAAALAVANQSAAARLASTPTAPGDLHRVLMDLVMVTGWSAAALAGFDRPRILRPQLAVPATVMTRRPDIDLVRSRRGVAGFWADLDGLPVATPPRVMWDAAHLSRGTVGAVGALGDLATYLDRTRRFAVEELVGLVDEPAAFGLPTRPPRLLRACAEELRPGFSHSGTEEVARRIAASVCAELGLRLHPSPYDIVDADGRVLGEADLAVPDIRFDGEVDGPHHDSPSQQRHDRRRDRNVRGIDWVVERYPTSMIDDDRDAFRRRLRSDVVARARAVGRVLG